MRDTITMIIGCLAITAVMTFSGGWSGGLYGAILGFSVVLPIGLFLAWLFTHEQTKP